MTQNYYSIVFDVTIHNTDKGNFAIPKGVCRLFYIRDQMEVDFVVDDLNRNIRSFQRSTTSGQEIRIGTSAYQNGQRIRITLFNPNYSFNN